MGRLCGLLERVEQAGGSGGLEQAREAASAAASSWMVMAAERASEWATDPARDLEWERAAEALAGLDTPLSQQLLPKYLPAS